MFEPIRMDYCNGVKAGRHEASDDARSRAQRLGKVVSKRRNAARLTQDQVASQAGMPSSTVGAIETGATVNPGFFTVADIADVLQVRLDELAQLSRKGRSPRGR